MPSVDQMIKSDQRGSEISNEERKTCHDIYENDTSLHNVNALNGINSKSEQNGLVTMENKTSKNMNAHLVNTSIICLDKSPVKPVIIETNGTEHSQEDKMNNGVVNGCHGHSTKEEREEELRPENKQELQAEESNKSKTNTSAADEDSKPCKKPMSFDLLPDKISKKRTPSRRGKLARQRTVSETTSYQKEHYRMEHAISDPTGYESEIILGEEKESVKKDAVAGEPEKAVDLEEKKEGRKDEDSDGSTLKTNKEVDKLAENLSSSLKIDSTSTTQNENDFKEANDQQVSDLADDLKKGLSVTDDGKNDKGSTVITIKKEVSEVHSEEIIIKEEPKDAESSSGGVIVKKEPSDLDDSSTCKKQEEDGVITTRLSEDKKREPMLSRGVGVDGRNGQPQFPNQVQNFASWQNRPNQTNMTGSVLIPSFQATFMQNPAQQQQMALQRAQFLHQRQMQIQNVQPPLYTEVNQQHQGTIIVPASQTSGTIVVPPSTISSHQRGAYPPNNELYQQHHFHQTQSHYTMPLQQPQHQPMVVLPSQRREPVESGWPPMGPFDDFSDTNSNASPPHIDEDPLPSPHGSVHSDTSMGLNPVSPLGSQGSPSAVHFPSSPYHRVPSLSPDLTQAHSPNEASSPGSPTSKTIKTGNTNFGVVTINDIKPSSPKRPCIEDTTKQQEVSNIVEYLKQGSPQSVHEQEPETIQIPPVTQPAVTTNHHSRLPSSPSSVGGYVVPVSPAGSSISSCDTPPPPGPSHHYQPEPQRSPPPAMSVVSQPYPYATPQPHQHMVLPQGYYPGGTYPQTQTSGYAVMPVHSANQPDFELQELKQKVSRLSDEQLREQDEDKDTVLHLAIIQEQKPLVQALVERQSRTTAMNMKNKLSQTPVYLAAVINQPEFVRYLIYNGADPTIPAEHPGDTPLHVAARQGYVEVIEAIFQGLHNVGKSWDDFIDRKNFDGKSPLHCAVESHGELDHNICMSGMPETIDSLQTIEVLMKYGASAMCQDGKSGKTPLHYAIEMHKGDITQLLLDRCDNAGDLVNSQTYNGNTALHLIVGRTQIPKEEILKVVALLMSRGANVSIENAEKETPVRLVQNGHDVIKRHLSGQAHEGTRK